MTTVLMDMKRASAKPLRVLIVDDSEADVESLDRMLRKQFGGSVQITQAESGHEALVRLDDQHFDIALVDYRLPDMDGLAVLDELTKTHADVATVLLTGQGSERVAAQAIQRGARDYLVKRDITGEDLQSVVETAIESTRRQIHHAHEQKKLSQTNHEMDHYVRSLSHDMTANYMLLENSFQQIKNSCGAAPLPGLLRGVNHVEACLKESKRFLDDMVLLTKTGSVDTEPSSVDVRRLIDELGFELDEVLVERGIHIEIDGELPFAWCNETRLRQAIGNLVRNAVKHGCAVTGGKITISSPALVATDCYAWLRIHDNGRGIPAASRDEVFLPGRRLANTTAPGSGMGLAIVKKIVEQWGGRIFIDNCPQGTAFCLSLPIGEHDLQN